MPTMPGFLNRLPLARSLAGVLRRLRLLRPAPAPACGLGLDALPQGLGALPSGTPVALAWQDGGSAALWAQALVQDLLAQGPVFLLAHSEQAADALLQHAALEQARSQGRLTVWLLRAHARARSAGMSALFEEMRQAGLGPAHALLVLATPQWELWPSVAGVQQWGRQVGNWCRRRSRPVVFAFHGWTSAEEVLAPLRSLPEVFQHVALLGQQVQSAVLFVQRWNASEGPLFELRLGLRPDPARQRLAYDGSQLRGAAQRLVEAPDHYRVLATRAAVAHQRGVPAQWSVVEGLDAMAAACEGAVAATVLLDAGSARQQDALLELVYRLRRQWGRALKIVVLETQEKLRANLERALLGMGANRVVYREVGFARLLRLLEDLREDTFGADVPADFAASRASFMPDALRGYLPLPAFCDSVEAMLARSSPHGLPHSFLRLSMQPHVAHRDAIAACVALRDGDVLSADHDALYVFLFACSESDTEQALGRLFRIATTELFAAQTRFGSTDGVRTCLRALREAARKGVPDYSAERALAMPGAPAGPDQANARQAPAQLMTGSAAPQPPQPEDQGHASPAQLLATPSVHTRALRRRASAQAQGAMHAD